MPESKEGIRYDSTAIQFMYRERDRFYDLWLGLATEHAREAHRDRVLKEDFRATLQQAVGRLLEELPAESDASAG